MNYVVSTSKNGKKFKNQKIPKNHNKKSVLLTISSNCIFRELLKIKFVNSSVSMPDVIYLYIFFIAGQGNSTVVKDMVSWHVIENNSSFLYYLFYTMTSPGMQHEAEGGAGSRQAPR